jgi:hypothetical protein
LAMHFAMSLLKDGRGVGSRRRASPRTPGAGTNSHFSREWRSRIGWSIFCMPRRYHQQG